MAQITLAEIHKRLAGGDTSIRIAGYVRKSEIDWTSCGPSLAEKKEYRDQLVRIRMAECTAIATRYGLPGVTDWYVDMDISGSGELLDSRESFLGMTADIVGGKVEVVVTRELSRLWRDLIEQENWILKVEGVGALLLGDDIAPDIDFHTRTMLRRIIGSVNENQRKKAQEAVVRNRIKSIETGQSVGLTRATFGLTWNQTTKRHELDPARAPFVPFLFQTFLDCGAIAHKTARVINGMIDDYHPDAQRTVNGNKWSSTSILRMLRSPYYRQTAFMGEPKSAAARKKQGNLQYAPIEKRAEHLLPEIVPAQLISAVDLALAGREKAYLPSVLKMKAGRADYTYGGGIVRCAGCGNSLTCAKPQDYKPESGQPPRWISWICNKKQLQKERCDAQISIQQFRLAALTGRALSTLFADAPVSISHTSDQGKRGAPALALRQQIREKDSLASAADRIQAAKSRVKDMFVNGLITMEELTQRLAEHEQAGKKIALQRMEIEGGQAAQSGSLRPSRAVTSISPQEFERLADSFHKLWQDPVSETASPSIKMDARRHLFLKNLGCTIFIGGVLDTERMNRTKQGRKQYGRVWARVEIAALGMVGPAALHVDEHDEDFAAYTKWLGERKAAGLPVARAKKREIVVYPSHPSPAGIGAEVIVPKLSDGSRLALRLSKDDALDLEARLRQHKIGSRGMKMYLDLESGIRFALRFTKCGLMTCRCDLSAYTETVWKTLVSTRKRRPR